MSLSPTLFQPIWKMEVKFCNNDVDFDEVDKYFITLFSLKKKKCICNT